MSGFNISHTIKGVDKLQKAFKNFQLDAMQGQIKAVQEATLMIHEEAVKSIQDNSDGTPQVRYKPKRVVLVSHPGDPPNSDTGRAAQSVGMDFQDGGLTGRVGTNLKYLAALEFGTQTIAPRPWLSRAVQVTSKSIADIFKRAIRDTIKGVST